MNGKKKERKKEKKQESNKERKTMYKIKKGRVRRIMNN